MKTICIIYRVPDYELDRVRQGVPIEELAKLIEPTEFIPVEKPLYSQRYNNSRKKKSVDY